MSKGVAVTTDAPGMERLNLVMSFSLSQAVEVRPGPRVLLQALKGQGATQRLVLHRTDGKPLAVERFELDSADLAQVKLTPVSEPGEQGAQAGDVLVEVVLAEGDPVGTRGGRLSLFTNHPEQPEVVIALQVRVRPLIEPRPERVQLWVDEGTTAGRSTSIRLTSNHEQPFAITGIASSHPELFTGTAVTTDTRLQQTVQVALAEEVDLAALGRSVNGTLRVSSDDPAQPMVEVPVMVAKRVRTQPAARSVRPVRPAQPAGEVVTKTPPDKG